MRAPDGKLRTLSPAVAEAVRLEATLDASRLLNTDKLGVVARTVGEETVAGERAWVVEIGFEEGGAVKYLYSFAKTSKLILKITDPVTSETATYGDYRLAGGILEAHSVEVRWGEQPPLTFTLRSADFNTGLSNGLFSLPSTRVE